MDSQWSGYKRWTCSKKWVYGSTRALTRPQTDTVPSRWIQNEPLHSWRNFRWRAHCHVNTHICKSSNVLLIWEISIPLWRSQLPFCRRIGCFDIMFQDIRGLEDAPLHLISNGLIMSLIIWPEASWFLLCSVSKHSVDFYVIHWWKNVGHLFRLTVEGLVNSMWQDIYQPAADVVYFLFFFEGQLIFFFSFFFSVKR